MIQNKKKYSTPKCKVLGDISKLTMGGAAGKNDSGSSQSAKPVS